MAAARRHERGEKVEDKKSELLGLRIGDAEARVRAVLSRVAVFQREDEDQLIWRFREAKETEFAMVGLDRERRVRYVTALAAKSGDFRCAPLGDGSDVVRTGGEGNLDLRRTVVAGKDQITIIAKGISEQRLTSCSIKKASSNSEEEEEGERRKH